MRLLAVIFGLIFFFVSTSSQAGVYISIDGGRSKEKLKGEKFGKFNDDFRSDSMFENYAIGYLFETGWIAEYGQEEDAVESALTVFEDLFGVSTRNLFSGQYVKVGKRYDWKYLSFTPSLGLMDWELELFLEDPDTQLIDDGNNFFIDLKIDRNIFYGLAIGIKYRYFTSDDFAQSSYGFQMAYYF